MTCSDSNYSDEPRTWTREWLKRQVISSFDAGLAAGTRAREYLGTLGMDDARIFTPWDVVDNEHFRAGAERARGDSAARRQRLGLPDRYFLCVARFVPKKNLARLLEAYASYAGEAGSSAWSLVLSGSGPLEADLKAAVSEAGLAEGFTSPDSCSIATSRRATALRGVYPREHRGSMGPSSSTRRWPAAFRSLSRRVADALRIWFGQARMALSLTPGIPWRFRKHSR